MKYALLFLFVPLTTSANITCRGAVELSLRDAETTTRAINTMPISARVAIVWLQRDLNNLGNITAACRDEFDSKARLCGRLPALVKARASGMSWNVTGSAPAKIVLETKNSTVLSRIKEICR